MKKNKIFYTMISTAAAVSITLTGCGKTITPPPTTQEAEATEKSEQGDKESQGSEASVPTVQEVADYLMTVAPRYNENADINDILDNSREGLQEGVTRIKALSMISRAFGPMPEPDAYMAMISPKDVEFSDIPEWAASDIDNLNSGQLLTSTEDGKLHGEEEISSAEIETLVRRIYALYGTDLKDDFYATVNKQALGQYAKNIPEGLDSAGGSAELAEIANKQIKELILEIVNSKEDFPKDSKEYKIKSFYENILDTKSINEQGLKPVQEYLDLIDQSKNTKELMEAYSEIIKNIGLQPSGHFLFPALTSNLTDSNEMVLNLSPYFTSLPTEAYENKTSDYEKQKSFYVNILKLTGESEEDAKAQAEGLLAIEQVAAKAMDEGRENIDYSDISANYSILSKEELDALMPGIGFTDSLTSLGFHSTLRYTTSSLEVIEAIGGLINDKNLPALKAQAKIGLLEANYDSLGEELLNLYKEHNPWLTANGERPLEDQAAETVSGRLTNELGQLYIERHFSKETKEKAEEMCDMLVEAFRDRVKNLDWMSESSKEEALRKLDNLQILVGYPDEWPERETEILSYEDGGSYFGNIAAVGRTRLAVSLERQNLKKAETTFESSMPVYVANAAANRSTNTIVLPAVVLQAPNFDKDASLEANLGGAGMVIAHEITHVFDDQGAQYDADGNLRNWWSDADYEHFRNMCDKAEAFYDNEEVAPGAVVSGQAGLSENISDIGGVACVLQVLSGKEDADYDALFRSIAKNWAKASNYETTQGSGGSDHAPNKMRVNRVIVNFQEFYDTYDIKEGDGMYVAPEDRIHIW